MSRDALFDDSLDAAARAVEGSGIDLSGCKATLLRDLRGKIRLHIDWPEDREIPEGAKNQLKMQLDSIGPYGTKVVYLQTRARKDRDFPLAESLERERIDFTPDLGGAALSAGSPKTPGSPAPRQTIHRIPGPMSRASARS
jgi:hypothetical protein